MRSWARAAARSSMSTIRNNTPLCPRSRSRRSSVASEYPDPLRHTRRGPGRHRPGDPAASAGGRHGPAHRLGAGSDPVRGRRGACAERRDVGSGRPTGPDRGVRVVAPADPGGRGPGREATPRASAPLPLLAGPWAAQEQPDSDAGPFRASPGDPLALRRRAAGPRAVGPGEAPRGPGVGGRGWVHFSNASIRPYQSGWWMTRSLCRRPARISALDLRLSDIQSCSNT
jgi:hypothetical protein